MDFGCGEGASYPFLKEAFPEALVEGYEPSEELVSVAKALYGRQGALFMSKLEQIKAGQYELMYANGVFHHIKPKDRAEILKRIKKALTSKGVLAFWENNPWHIGTRIVMSRIPFDREAQTITPNQAKTTLEKQGLQFMCSISAFHIPFLEKVPWSIYRRLIFNTYGAQYLVLATR